MATQVNPKRQVQLDWNSNDPAAAEALISAPGPFLTARAPQEAAAAAAARASSCLASGAAGTIALPFPQPQRLGAQHQGLALEGQGSQSLSTSRLPSVRSANLPPASALSGGLPPSPASGGALGMSSDTSGGSTWRAGGPHAHAYDSDFLQGGSSLEEVQHQRHHHHQQRQQQQQQQRSRAAGAQAAAKPRSRPPTGEPRKSKYRGVQWERSCSKWRARIHTDKTRHIGYFDNEAEAAQAWDAAALKHFGLEWRPKLNFPDLSVERFQRGAEAEARQFRGVTEVDGKFKAVLQKDRAHNVIGVFATAEEAARAYDRETLRVNGRGAITNFPLSDYSRELDSWQAAYNLVTSSQPGQPLAPSNRAGLSVSGPPSSGPLPPAGLGCLPGADSADAGQRPADAAGIARQAGGSAAIAATSMPPSPHDLPRSSCKKRKLEVQEGPSVAAAALTPHWPPLGTGAAGAAGTAPSESLVGVMQVGDRWQAYLALDLGTFGSAEEAARVHDRASLMVRGLSTSALNAPLDSTLAAAQAAGLACNPRTREEQQQEQCSMDFQQGQGASAASAPASAAAQQSGGAGGRGGKAAQHLRGVVPRGDAFCAVLDTGNGSHELGPFPTAAAAAEAFDRYSLLLNGLLAPTNAPLWRYLVPAAEEARVRELVRAVQQCRPQHGGLAALASAHEARALADALPARQAAQQEQRQQQQQQEQQALRQAADRTDVTQAQRQRQQQQQPLGASLRLQAQPLQHPSLREYHHHHHQQQQQGRAEQQGAGAEPAAAGAHRPATAAAAGAAGAMAPAAAPLARAAPEAPRTQAGPLEGGPGAELDGGLALSTPLHFLTASGSMEGLPALGSPMQLGWQLPQGLEWLPGSSDGGSPMSLFLLDS